MAPRRSFSASILASAIALSPGAGQAPAAGVDRSTIVARIDSLATAFVDSTPVPSVAIAVLRGGDVLALKAFGYAELERQRPATAETVYRIGSLTKQFTAAAIMRLVEQGRIRLDDDVSKYVPGFPLRGQRVTLRHLLNHTSGIHNYTAKPEWARRWADDLSPDSITAFVARDTFDFAPGTRYSYSNTGYVLLGMVIEKVSNGPYAAFIDREFFKPLGLTGSSYCPSLPADPAFAVGYDRRGGSTVPTAYLSMTHPYAAGALCMTAPDFLAWQRALSAGRVVSPASYARMTTPDTLIGGRRMTYGFGLGVGMLEGHRAISHSGGINGFTSFHFHFPDDSLGIVVFDNSTSADPGSLARNIARVVFGIAPVGRVRVPPAAPLAAADRAKLVGTYDLIAPTGAPLIFTVRVEGDLLIGAAMGQGSMPLIHLGGNVFTAAFDPTLRLTFVVEGDRVTRLRLLQNGATIEGGRR